MGFIEIYKKPKYSNWITGYPNQKIYFTDMEVAKLVRAHTHWWDRLNYHKMCDAGHFAKDILCGKIEAPAKKNWTFNDVIAAQCGE